MKEKINLGKILEEMCEVTHDKVNDIPDVCILAMMEAVGQALKLAAEKAKIKTLYYDKDDNLELFEANLSKPNAFERVDYSGEPYAIDVVEVDKNSILDVINLIE